MGLQIAGHHEEPAWPKLGTSLLVATCLIVAIRTARRSANEDPLTSDIEMEKEIAFAAYVAGRTFATLVAKFPRLFPAVQKAWYQPDGEDHPE